jgi:hypothetical protein
MRLLIFLLAIPLLGADLSPRTERAFERYLAAANQEMAAAPVRIQATASSGVKVLAWGEDSTSDVHEGIIHDWVGSVFVPGVTATQAIALLTDFQRHAAIYAPEVAASGLVSRDGDLYRSTLRLVKKKVLTVVLDTEYETRYSDLGNGRWLGVVRSTRIQEVDNPGEKDEELKPAGAGQGFLWRLNSWWVIVEQNGGVLLQLRSVSLTRDIPVVLAWAVKPMVTSLPRESLAATLEKTAAALRRQ